MNATGALAAVVLSLATMKLQERWRANKGRGSRSEWRICHDNARVRLDYLNLDLVLATSLFQLSA